MGQHAVFRVVVRPHADGPVARRGGVLVTFLEAHDGGAHILVLIDRRADDAPWSVGTEDVLDAVHGFARLVARDPLE